MKKILVYLLLFLILAGGGFYWVKYEMTVSSGTVDVFHGATPKQIGGLLEQSNIVKNGNVFYYYIRLKQEYYRLIKKDNKPFVIAFREGQYHIKAGNLDQLINQLNSDGRVLQKYKSVTIPEGSSINDMAKIISKSGLFTSDDFLSYVNNKENYLTLKKDYTWLPDWNPNVYYPLEGYLEANTYHFPLDATPEKVVRMMLEETNNWYNQNLVDIKDLIENNKLHSFAEIVTLASIVERESKFDKDRPIVSQVFYNRLKLKMPLESDITASYGNKQNKVFMTNNDISKVTPYNTYKFLGLPSGPICSPSFASLKAVLKPVGDYFNALYFYARPSGETFYQNTSEQHDAVRKQYENEWIALQNK